ncbi:DNA methyltransferase [Spirillospora sp. NPDC047279]|uniref:Eco57I restriction-modification methylase domain-containing protein n=1 Tax=Spirillospora sp. NPDC047279 TaxID=3155478 RepID=UPI0033BFDC50
MDKQARNAIDRATQRARSLLEDEFAEQLEADFDVLRSGKVATQHSPHLTPHQVYQRRKIVAVLEHRLATGMSTASAVTDYIRESAFTTLNRFVALKMLEARELVQECVSKGEESVGYREFCGMASGLPLLPGGAGYRLYIESLFDELSTEVKVLFDRRDPASVLWPRRAPFDELLAILNAQDLAGIWAEDETIGWFYQYFNSENERRRMRDESQAPRNGRELAIRNQFFTPRYVVQFLTDNTLGRIWYEMRGTDTALAERCEYMVCRPGEQFAPRSKKDPRDIRVLDPACGSGHFLLYAFDLLIMIYEEAYVDAESPASEVTGRTLAEDYTTLEALRQAIPSLVLAHNLHGVDIDPRCAQIAQLALWLRAQRAYRDFGIGRNARTPIRRSNIIIAEPLVADDQVAADFVGRLNDPELAQILKELVGSLALAGDLGLLLPLESGGVQPLAPGYEHDLLTPPKERLHEALHRFSVDPATRASIRRRLFSDDASYGLGLISIADKRYDTVLMNPPFGSGSARAKKVFDKLYPLTKNDVYAAFVERGIDLLTSRGRLGAITSRSGFFLSRFQKWREEIVLRTAPPVVFADLGNGVLDGAMVETAAYCLEADN